jgi:hypothetical protein
VTTTTLTTTTTMPVCEHLYDLHLQLTEVTSYGINLEDLNSGRVAPPPEGTRFDMAFEGMIEGPRASGTIKGYDYVIVRADGRRELNLWATVTTADGARLALFGTGVALADPANPGIVQIRENAQLTSHDPRYVWVNQIQLWVTGTVDMSDGTLHLSAYAA